MLYEFSVFLKVINLVRLTKEQHDTHICIMAVRVLAAKLEETSAIFE